MTLTPIDMTNTVAVTDYLTQCRDWLATCVEMTGPDQIARAKAEIATAAEATKQLGLSKEIQLDAQEMVRRAEYALGKAIRKGQADGVVGTPSSGGGGVSSSDTGRPKPTDFAKPSELYPNPKQAGIYDLSDGVSDQTFEDAIERAKAEGNLSRSNVARKIIGKSGDTKPAPTSASDDAALALINDIRGPWTRGITKSARLMNPKARAHLIDALENALTQLRSI